MDRVASKHSSVAYSFFRPAIIFFLPPASLSDVAPLKEYINPPASVLSALLLFVFIV